MTEIQLDLVTLVVSDMTKIVEFYRALGVEVQDPEPPWADVHRASTNQGEIGLDFDSASFAGEWNSGWPGGTGVLIGFRVPSREAVDEVFGRAIAAGYQGQQEPYDAFWGARYAVLSDPDGNAVGLMSPMDPDRRTEPPNPAST